jgi:hypothetical protein
VTSRAGVRGGIGSLFGSVDETVLDQRSFEVKTAAEGPAVFSVGEGAKSDAKIYKRVRTRFVNTIIF